MADEWRRSGVEFIVKDSTRAGVSGVQRSLDRLDRGARSVVRSVTRIGGSLAALAGIGSIAGVTLLVREQMGAVDAAAKWSDRLGMATEDLTAMHHAAELSGVGVSQFNMAMQRMTRRVAEAAVGTGEAKDAIAELGLDATALAQKSPDQMFLDIADAISGVGNQADRVRLAFKLFDSEGVTMLNILKSGREGVRGMMEEAERLGLTLDRIDAAQIEAANDAMTRAKGAAAGLARQIAVDLAPYIEGVADQFTEAAANGQDFGDEIATAMEAVAVASAKAYDILKDIADLFGQIGKADTWLRQGFYTRAFEQDVERRTNKLYEEQMQREGKKPWLSPLWHRRGNASFPERWDQAEEIVRQNLLPDFAKSFPGIGVADRSQTVRGVEQFFDDLRARGEQRREQQRGEFIAGKGHSWLEQPFDFSNDVRQTRELGDATDETAEQMQKARDAVAELESGLADAILIKRRMAEGDRYAAEMLEYERLVMQAYGADTAEAASKIEEFRDRLEDLHGTAEQSGMLFESVRVGRLLEVADAAKLALEELSGTLTDIAMDFENASQYAERFADALARMMIQELVMRPLVRGIGEGLGLSYAPGEVQHAGGVAGTGPTRIMEVTAWAAAQRFHEGGTALGVDEVAAILKRREVVLTESDADRYRMLGLMDAQGKPTFHGGGVVGGTGAEGASVAPTGGPNRPNVSVKVDNRSGSDVEAGDVGVEIDPDEYIINVVLRDHAAGGRTRDLMRRR